MTTSLARLLVTLLVSLSPALAHAQTLDEPGTANAAIRHDAPDHLGCDDGDPCTDDVRSGSTCVRTPSTGLVGIACACTRAAETACGTSLPAGMLRKTARACAPVSPTAGDPGRAIRRSAHHWSGALRLARTPAARRSLGAACADALAGALDDAVTRAQWLLAGG
ncbi:MAG TPA: hypothetical protein VGR62_11980 [Candidatus Binatia bacterium]|jgi:hypothetical protein|nr:hypothetical protein [Candidatus Binatia bacterium]